MESFSDGGYRFDNYNYGEYSGSLNDDFEDDFNDDLDDDLGDDFDEYNGCGQMHNSSGRDYGEFEDRCYYSYGNGYSYRKSRNTIPNQKRREVYADKRDHQDSNHKKGMRRDMSSTPMDYFYGRSDDDYDDDEVYDDYFGRSRAPAGRTPEEIPPIYIKYLSNTGQNYEEHYGKTAKKNNIHSLSSYSTRKRLKVISVVLGCVALFLVTWYYFSFVCIYHPVKIDNSIVNLQTDDVTTMLRSVVGAKLSDKTINVVVCGETFSINLGEYGFNYSSAKDGSTTTSTDTDANGNEVITTIATYKNICYNQTKMEELLNSISSKYGTVMVKPSYTIDGDQLIIRAGSDGVGIDENSLLEQILEHIKLGNYSECLVGEMVTTHAPAVDIDKIYKEVVCEVKDASSYVDENGETIYISDVVGKKFNLEEARATIANGGNSWTINLSLTHPKLTLVELKAPTCPDLLAETTTEFKTSNKTRAANIKNAAKRINTYGSFEDGYILQPGEIFSFNDTVGERTEANGFSIATVYTNTGTSNDVGGGICQVSSAIFSAAFKADLEIVSRTNHMYRVHYWTTPGEDATVNWGTLDFKFQNSKTYPIKIKMIYANKNGMGTITCQVWGTDDGYRCEFDNKTIKQVLTTTIQKPATSSKPKGTKEWGEPGMTVEIYRVRYKDNVQISKELMWTSIYQPLATIEYV